MYETRLTALHNMCIAFLLITFICYLAYDMSWEILRQAKEKINHKMLKREFLSVKPQLFNKVFIFENFSPTYNLYC